MKSRRQIFRRILKPAWLYFFKRTLDPLSHNYGANRGNPVDRYFIENFLEKNKDLIHGVCLEIKDNFYTRKFGHNVTKSDVLDIDSTNPQANIYDDLRNLRKIGNNNYDCIILTQVLQFIDDYQSAIKECHRILKPNGVLLATVPALSRIDVRAGEIGDFWRFTQAGATHCFGQVFGKNKIEVQAFGNIVTGLGFWVGQATEEFSKEHLAYADSNFPVSISVKAVK